MVELKTLLALVPDDEHGWMAVCTAASLARRADADLGVAAVAQRLPVVETFTPSGSVSEIYLDAIADALERRARDFLAETEWTDAPVLREKGDLAGAAARAAGQVSADLVVLGSGNHGISRSLTASAADRIIHMASLPVLVTPEPRRRAYRRVLVGVDLMSRGKGVTEAAALIAQVDGAALRALHVHESIPMLDEVGIIDDTVIRRDAEESLHRIVADLDLPETVASETVFRYGHAGHEILAEAEEWGADLVVIGSHGAGLMERLMMLGSSARHVLHHCDGAALVVPCDGAVT